MSTNIRSSFTSGREKRRKRVLELFDSGLGIKIVAERVGMSASGVSNIIKRRKNKEKKEK